MSKRWMAEIQYRRETFRPVKVVSFEELYDLHDIVERGPDWNEIEQIIVTLNRNSATVKKEIKEEQDQ